MITTAISLAFASLLANDFSLKTPFEKSSLSTDQSQNREIKLPASQIPVKKGEFIEPILKAKAILSLDLENGFILYEKNKDEKLPMASITKLMTVAIILEENGLEETVTVPSLATKVEGSKIWLSKGEKISIKNLLKAALIASANDAAMALALHNSESIEKFVEKMNKKAQLLGMYNTHFKNPTGLDEENHYSSAYDLGILARYLMRKNVITSIVNQKEDEISSEDKKLKHKLVTTNELLSSYLKVLGLKTGTTDLAGACLISIIENEKGNKIANILLNSPDRFQESKILAEWVFKAYKWN